MTLRKLTHGSMSSYPAFVVGEFPLVLQLIGKRQFDLRQLAHLTFKLFHLSEKVGVLGGHLLFGSIHIVKGPVGFVHLVLVFIEHMLLLLHRLLCVGLRERLTLL